VSIRIDPKIDRPWERDGGQFRHPNLLQWVSGTRGRLIAAALTLLRAWVAAGRPEGQANLGSYESWSRVVGGVLEVAGISAFLENRTRFYDRADRETGAWRVFVAAWYDRFGNKDVGVKDLWELIEPPDANDGEPVEPPVDLGHGSERSQRTRFGTAMAQAVDRRFTIDGVSMTIVSAGTYRRAARFRIEV